MVNLRCHIKTYLQPFERQLALAELAAVAGSRPRVGDDSEGQARDFMVTSTTPTKDLISRLAYWESLATGRLIFTEQVLREATVSIARNGVPLRQIPAHLPFNGEVPVPRRRVLRYGTHGIHEYRGKFFPQLVRALANIAGVRRRSVVADPMCGSGTTLVEATQMGCLALGLDMNPLSVLMAETKCELLSAVPDRLLASYEFLNRRLTSKSAGKDLAYFATLPDSDQKYLRRWFSPRVLADLDRVAQGIRLIGDDASRKLFWLSLSNVLRRVSWQKTDDLRIRREIPRGTSPDAVGEFLSEAQRSCRSVLAFVCQIQGKTLGKFKVEAGDARRAAAAWQSWVRRVDLVITSPPYATALPYIDTDRLSLSYLGLLAREEHREQEKAMIGNREVSETWRVSYWRLFEKERSKLPQSVVRLVERIHHQNSKAAVGFRKRNLPSLLAKYFFDMREALTQIATILKPDGIAYVVVGSNHTYAGSQRCEIDTPALLGDIAADVGLRSVRCVRMEMLTSRDIFRRNSASAEVILDLRRS